MVIAAVRALLFPAIGLMRGSTRGGNWGISFVHKPIKDGAQSSRPMTVAYTDRMQPPDHHRSDSGREATGGGVVVDTFSGPINDFAVMYSVVPLLKVEVQGAVIMTPGLSSRSPGSTVAGGELFARGSDLKGRNNDVYRIDVQSEEATLVVAPYNSLPQWTADGKHV